MSEDTPEHRGSEIRAGDLVEGRKGIIVMPVATTATQIDLPSVAPGTLPAPQRSQSESVTPPPSSTQE